MPITRGVRQEWAYGTSDGRIKISGHGRECEEVTVETHQEGSGFGMSETPSVTCAVKVSAQDFHELVALVAARLAPPKRAA